MRTLKEMQAQWWSGVFRQFYELLPLMLAAMATAAYFFPMPFAHLNEQDLSVIPFLYSFVHAHFITRWLVLMPFAAVMSLPLILFTESYNSVKDDFEFNQLRAARDKAQANKHD